MKVSIDSDREGWFYGTTKTGTDGYLTFDTKSERVATYADAKALAARNGHEVDNAGWKRRMLSWNWNHHAMDGYPGWEIEKERSPAFVKLTHVRGKERSDVESSALCNAWDDIAAVDFYQRDWTNDGIPFVHEGETYWSGWWFATIAERDRFVAWHKNRKT